MLETDKDLTSHNRKTHMRKNHKTNTQTNKQGNIFDLLKEEGAKKITKARQTK